MAVAAVLLRMLALLRSTAPHCPLPRMAVRWTQLPAAARSAPRLRARLRLSLCCPCRAARHGRRAASLRHRKLARASPPTRPPAALYCHPPR